MDLRRDGLGVRQIAVVIGGRSTVSRELRRNVDEGVGTGAHEAQPPPRARRVTMDAFLGAAVCKLLAKRWSPEQVAHELIIRFAGQPAPTTVPGEHLPGQL
ncbi:MAG: hypothetical protein WCG47_18110 [Dermatophilaceae bacterium]